MRRQYLKPQSKELGCVSAGLIAESYEDVPSGGLTDKFDAKEQATWGDDEIWAAEW